MKLVWLTDIHLNFLEKEKRMEFYHNIISKKSDGVLISGDIAEAPSIVGILQEMSDQIKNPIYFVLGNHDYYKSSINEVKKTMISLTETEPLLHWLPAAGIQNLGEDIILLGQDGWADGRLGDYQNSRLSLNDSRLIADLFQQKILGKYHLLEKMQELADEDAQQLEDSLLQASRHNPKKIIILTHVPPFKEACLHEGKISNDDGLPYFASKATGDVLMQIATKNPAIEFLVLCGHTHNKAYYKAADNLIIKVGKAENFRPEIQETITILGSEQTNSLT